ncbi:MAG: rhomboid family intramembrane serine protease [Defluviitaleaceae bacterium]|nr:rhomboid family intramembrane serine protease [Defluviitaleaceae bacterium]
MNPLRRIQYNAPVTLTFTLVSAAALAASLLTGGYTDALLFSVYRAGSVDFFMFVRLFGHAFGHADINHYLGNFVLILLLGPMLEEKYGGKWIALMMAATALVTGLIFMLVSKPGSAMLGASGVVFMMMLLASFTNLRRGRLPLTFLLALIVFVGRELYAGFSTGELTESSMNISYMSHIAGGLCGALFGFVANKEKILDGSSGE